MRLLDHDEIQALVEAIDGRYPRHPPCGVLRVALRGIAAPRVESINVPKRTVDVSASLNEVNGTLTLGPPKTSTSRRKLAKPRFLADHLSAYFSKHPPEVGGLLITGPSGGGLRQSNFRKRVWLPAVEATVGQPCTFHDLRHCHAALLIREGLHPKVTQERMGHASIRTTLDTYGHLFPGLDQAAADALDESVRGAGVGLAQHRAL